MLNIHLLQSTPKQLVVTVKDNGAGIKATDLPYVFNRYFQGGKSPKGVAGIGLDLRKNQQTFLAVGLQ